MKLCYYGHSDYLLSAQTSALICPIWTLRNNETGEIEKHLTHSALLRVSELTRRRQHKKAKQMSLKGNHLSFKNNLSSAL